MQAWLDGKRWSRDQVMQRAYFIGLCVTRQLAGGIAGGRESSYVG